jgi:tetratricopeptide (TPR) repeat protein
MIAPNRSRASKRRLCAAFTACALVAVACATAPPLARQQCENADAQLASLLQPYEALRAKGCAAGPGESDCDHLRREIARLAVICPAHAPTLMANAVIAYDERRQADAQQLLDQILAQPRSYPDAAVLRGEIAIEEGNVPFALRMLNEQIKLVPDHAGLHETYAAALYLDGRMAEATSELTLAEALGAPPWRVAYHRGLIEEAAGRRDEAARYYAAAVEGNPGFQPAASRLKALRAVSAARP